MQVFRNQEFRTVMVELVSLLRPSTYVELGCKVGYTFNAIAPLVKRAVAVDCRQAHIDKIVRRPNVEVFCGTTEDFLERWQDPIDFAFIDADHRAVSVLRDFNGIAEHLVEGTGLVFLHDTHPMSEELLRDDRCSDAWQAAYTLKRQSSARGLEVLTLPGPYAGMTIVRKFGGQVSWMR